MNDTLAGLVALAGNATVDVQESRQSAELDPTAIMVAELVELIKADTHGWRSDVLSRLYREGKLDAGSVSCKGSMSFLQSKGLARFFPENRDDDMDYQLTYLGRRVAYEIVEDVNRQTFEKGDLVVLDPIEWDNLPGIYKVQGFITDGSILVVDIADYDIVVDLDFNASGYKGWLIQPDELSHVTWDEEQLGYRI